MSSQVSTESYDLVVIGAGIIGLASAISALEFNASYKVMVLEKEKDIGVHASGRNSGVVHAGFYYSPDSLKAQFCRVGNQELKSFARQHKLPINNCGKVIVTTNDTEDVRVETLFNRGICNGVDLELLPGSDLSRFEPTAKTNNLFVWSPQTSILDPGQLLQKLLDVYISMGGKIAFNVDTELSYEKGEVVLLVNRKRVETKKIVNAAGAFADQLAKQIGVGTRFAVVPFKGSYRKSAELSISKTLIYPVPHPINPFLGVHTTITPEGYLKIGPTAMLAFGRENYGVFENLHPKEVLEILKAVGYIVKGRKHNLIQIMMDEIPLLSLKGLVGKAGHLSNEVTEKHSWKNPPPGIRSQLVDVKTGELVQDFVVEEFGNTLHFLNIVSPGWTSAFPFTRHFMGDFLRK
jgi:L-2-hydroxyglutarate oxidase